MKKKLISLALVLALTLALMLPTFAAVTQPAQTHACNHNWILSDRIIERYQMINGIEHRVYYYYMRTCALCAVTERAPGMDGSFLEGHWPPCYKCHCGV